MLCSSKYPCYRQVSVEFQGSEGRGEACSQGNGADKEAPERNKEGEMVQDAVMILVALAVGFMAASFIAMVIWTEEISPRLQDLAEAFIEEAYEPAAYKAAKELTESGNPSYDYNRWVGVWKPIMKLRRFWTTKTRNRLESAHYSHHDKFPYVKFEVDWRKAGTVRMWMPAWSVVLLDEQHRELIRYDAVSEAHAFDVVKGYVTGTERYEFRGRKAQSFIILDPKEKVRGSESIKKPDPEVQPVRED